MNTSLAECYRKGNNGGKCKKNKSGGKNQKKTVPTGQTEVNVHLSTTNAKVISFNGLQVGMNKKSGIGLLCTEFDNSRL